ncbi:MAG TPA: sn-glycerol-3-phosphate ABC transporter ATP-binding protein UgpC [Gammaproteobacteria bacterium]|nr:sn-glycerol-3-phosphate ABC transporter ATP-binding protein UgpC [Gammaproteobacteria bacterium]
MAAVEFRSVEKVFPDGTRAIDRLSLEVEDGELLVLLGPSGCGKSTLLRLLAGLETLDGGEIRIGARVVNTLGPRERNVAMVFQNYALYPHMSVRRNLEFPLRMQRMARSEIARRVERTARALGLEAVLERRPKALSGGQRQRVAMGRAMVREPEVFLMDEPLSNLDAKLRVQIRAEIAELQRRLATTMLYVTHDQVEAMTLGRRVAVLRDGVLQQVGPPQTLYERPANLFVAAFVGSPEMNLFRAELTSQDGVPALGFGEQRLPLVGPAPPDGAVFAGLRPEAFSDPSARPELPSVAVDVAAAESLGHERLVYFRSPVTGVDTEGRERGADSFMAARLPVEAEAHSGRGLRLAVDMGAVYWFDGQGQALSA